jgi:hypothetical protein
MHYIIRVAFYKNSKTNFWKAIRFKQKNIDKLWEFSKYSHVELVFKWDYVNTILKSKQDIFSRIFSIVLNTNMKCYSFDDWLKYGLRFSSSEVDWWTRFKFIDDNKWNWDYHDIEVSKQQYLDVLNFCIKQNNKRYNYVWIVFAQIFKTLLFYKKDSWFCSQVVTAWLQEIKRLCWVDAISISPWRLAKILYNR